ncbi:MAG: hypothetical protein KJS90_10375 [Acidobacteria bacterium]|nr:hypothetical protein [Acidobacteriota bacterium]
MSSSYSPTAEFTDSTTVLADGDAASATNLNAAPKKALDRAAYLRAATDGLLVWAHKARVATGGTNNGNFAVYVPAIEAVSLLDSTTWKAFSVATETQLTSAAHFGSMTLANDTNYYVYATVSGGVLTFEVSTTAPDAALIWKTGATGTHRYLFCFHTSSAGVPLAMQMSRGRYLYRFSALTTELRALNTSSAVGATDVILARGGVAGRELLPAHARIARLLSEVTAAGNHIDDTVQVNYGMNGDLGTGAAFIHRVYGPSTATNQAVFDCECDSARTIDYSITLSNTDAGNPTTTTNLYVVGFEE